MLALVMWVGYTVIGLRDSSIKQEFQNVQMAKETGDLRLELSALKAQVQAATQASLQATATIAATAAAAEDRKKLK